MLRFAFLAICLSAATSAAAQTIGNATLTFQVSSGGNDNFFFRDNITSAQLLLTSANSTSSVRRFVAALPAGNSGALVYFLPLSSNGTSGSSQNSSQLGVTLANSSIQSTTDEYNNTGVQADLTVDGNATLGVTVIGAVRAMRDYVEGGGLTHEIFNYTLNSYNSSYVRLHRQNINATGGAVANASSNSSSYLGADLYLSVPDNSSTQFLVTPGDNGTFTPPTINILVPPGSNNGTVRLRLLTNESSLNGLDTGSLFLAQNDTTNNGLQTALNGLANGNNTAAQQISFLTYTDKFTAGGWRFLTYFGRDTLIALRLLMPTLTSEAIEAVLGAVIERTNSTGVLCHEETIGDYASFVNIGNNQSYLGNQPYYDYKMIDTDLLLLPAISHYFLELPQGQNRSSQFLAKNATLQNGTYAEILNRTINYNLERALPFCSNQSASNLLALRPGQPVGNWRDSNQGLGYGVIPFDVNTALVPASLRATFSLVNASIIAQPNVSTSTGGNGSVADVAAAWEAYAPSFFDVSIDNATAQGRLINYVHSANLSEALLSSNMSNSSSTGNVSFYALSLMTDGTPVQVMNSDISFNLMYGYNVSQTVLQHVVDVLQPYPRGLLTDIGMVVANPAYDSNTTNIQVLDHAAYHGTVVWSFQQGLMAGGLARQLSFCSSNSTVDVDTNTPPSPPPAWCTDSTFVQTLEDAQTRLWASIKGAQSEIFSEVWSYSFDNTTNTFSVADLASISPDGTESDAIQLWSYGFLALLDPSGAQTTSS